MNESERPEPQRPEVESVPVAPVESAASVESVASVDPSIQVEAAQASALDMSVLDPSRNGTLDTLQRIERNTEQWTRTQKAEADANVRSLRKSRARPGAQPLPLVPGATIAPVAQAAPVRTEPARKARSTAEVVSVPVPSIEPLSTRRTLPERGADGRFKSKKADDVQAERYTQSMEVSEETRDSVSEVHKQTTVINESIEDQARIEGELSREEVEATKRVSKTVGEAAKQIVNAINSQGGGGVPSSIDDALLEGDGEGKEKRKRGRPRKNRGGRNSSPVGPDDAKPGMMQKAGDLLKKIPGATKAGELLSKLPGSAMGTKLLGAAAAPIAGYMAYSSKSDELADRDDLTDAQKTTQATATAVGAGGGALAGAATGATIGATAGSVVPVVGTAVGGVVGAIVGGIAGEWGGDKIGEAFGEAISDTMDTVEDEATKALDERETAIEAEAKADPVKWYNPMSWFNGPREAPAPAVPNRPGQTSATPFYTPKGNTDMSKTDSSILTSTTLGRVSEKFESGGRGVGTISTGVGDAGGVSYGKHQLASKTGTMEAFVKSKENEKYASQFAGLKPGTEAFNQAYKSVVQNDGAGFAEAQHAFIKRTHFDPVANYAKAKGIDVNDPGVQEALWSQSVQHSGKGNRKIIDDAIGRAGKDATPEQIISSLYDARGDYASQFASNSATTARYEKERKDALAVTAQAKSQKANEAGQTMVAEAEKPKAPEAAQGKAPAVAENHNTPVQEAPPVASLVANNTPVQAPTVAPEALSDVVVPMQNPELIKPPMPSAAQSLTAMQAKPAPTFDSKFFAAEMSKALQAALGKDETGKKGDKAPLDGSSSKDAQMVANNVPIEFDDTLMMLMAHDRV